MVTGEVGENSDIEGDLVEAVEGEAVAGGLDDGVLAVGLDHLAEQALHLGRLGGGHAVGVALDVGAGHVGVHGAESTDADARGFENGREDVGGGCLAVGTGDADDRELAAGVAVEGGGGLRQRHAGVLDGDDGLVAGEVAPGSPAATLDDNSGRPCIKGVGEEGVTINGEAGNGDEEGACCDAAGVVLDVLDDDVTVATHKLGAGNLLDERCKHTSVAHRSRPAPSCSVIEGTTQVKEIG